MSIPQEATTGGLRERNKAKRRDAILDAALKLFDRPDPAAITTERIAELAEVSPATVYNLVGTREQLLLALIDRLIAAATYPAFAPQMTNDPIETLRYALLAAVDVVTSRPVAFRQIVLQLAAAANADMHTKLSPATAAAAGIRRAQEAGTISSDFAPDALAMQIYLSFNGALLRWAAGVLSDAAFRAAALHGMIVVLAAVAIPRRRARLLEELRTLGPALTG